MSSVLYIRQMKVKFSAWLYLTAVILTVSNFAVAQTPNEVKIGTQVWMTKNLDVSKFRNGDPIPEAKNEAEWAAYCKAHEAAYCYWGYDPSNASMFGKLYNGYAVTDSRGLAPKGWHIPVDWEWSILIGDCGGIEVAGGRMKTKTGWPENGNGTNSSGLSIMPSGENKADLAPWYYTNYWAAFWTSSEMESGWTCDGQDGLYIYRVVNSSAEIERVCSTYRSGLSIRCVKGNKVPEDARDQD
jgi:uncharacterized protein (TIGR02145 family)